MSEKEKLFEYLEVNEYFGEPEINNEPLTNPAQLMLDEEKLRMLRLCGERTVAASDYELFERFVNSLHMMRGSSVYELFFEELRRYFDYEADAENLNASELWRTLCKKIETWGYRYPVSRISKNPVRVLPTIEGCGDIDSLILRNIDLIASSECNIAAVDISDIAFERSDKYHASLAYSEYIGGNAQKKGTVLWGVLYRVCEYLREKRGTLFAYIGDNYDAAEKMVEYFSDRGILPDMTIFSSGETLKKVASALCGAYGDDTRSVLCGLVFDSGDTVRSISESVKEIARVYPVTRLYLCGSVTHTRAVAARLELLKRGFARAIEDINESDEISFEK